MWQTCEHCAFLLLAQCIEMPSAELVAACVNSFHLDFDFGKRYREPPLLSLLSTNVQVPNLRKVRVAVLLRRLLSKRLLFSYVDCCQSVLIELPYMYSRLVPHELCFVAGGERFTCDDDFRKDMLRR